MKKVGAILFFFIIAISSFAIAQNNSNNTGGSQQQTGNNVAKAYQCLSNLIDDKNQQDLSLHEAVFSTLALGSNSKLTERINSDKNSENCWPKSSCNIRDTAQVLLGYDRINKNSDEIESWLLSRNKTASQLTWYLEIDISNHRPSTCTLTYQDNAQRTININEDMTISGNPGTCFTIAQQNFWLKVKDSCFGQNFRVSCDQDFITSLLYQKTGSSTVFVSPNTHSAASSGTTEEKVESQCFGVGNSCDYEGSLWASVALNKKGHDISSLLPYLSALAEDNKKFFPETFLYTITSGNDYYSQIVQSQKQNQFWQAPNSQYNKFYDTALALLSLQGASSQEFTNSQNYLLGIQTPEGCWNNNNIRDTAFLLYSGWSKSVPADNIGIGGETIEQCESAGFFCESEFSCVRTGGQTLNNYQCDGLKKCCSVPVLASSCSEQGGILCSASQQCSGTSVQSSESETCCLGTCEAVQQTNNCQLNGGACSFSCDPDTEEQTSESCSDLGLVCCILKQESDRNLLPLIIILTILVILLILAIIFRKRLHLWFFQLKNKRKGPPPVSQGLRPSFPPRPIGMPPRGTQRPVQRPPSPTRQSQSDKELEDTLKKLKEMSE